MRRLIDIIVAIFELGRAAYDNVDFDESRDFHARYIARSIWLLAGLILVMVGINYIGFKEVNIFISLFLCLAVLTIATRPEPLVAAVLAGLTSGVIQRPQTMVKEVRCFLFLFFRSLGDVVFWISIFGMFLGTVSCKGNPGTVAAIAIALVVIGYGSYKWKMGPVLYKRVIYGYAIFIFLFSLINLPSHATWMHYAKFDPISILRASDEEDILAEVEKASAKKESDANIEILREIKKDIKDGKDLKQWQIDFLEEMKRKRDANSIPSRVADTFSSVSLPSFGGKDDEYVPMPAPAPASAPAAQVAEEAPAPAPAPEKWELCVKNTCNPITVITLSDSNIELEQIINGIKVSFSGSGTDGNFTGIWEKDGISDAFSLDKKSPALYVGEEQSGKNAFPMKLKRV